MRVLILPSYYPTADEPNRGIFFQQQAQLCVRQGIEIHVLYQELRSLKKISSASNWKNRFQVKACKENNLLVFRRHAWNIIPTKFELGNKIWINASFQLFEKYIERYGKPDVIHVQSAFPAAILAARIKKKYGIPYFINEHTTRIRLGTFSGKELNTYQQVFKNSYCVVAVSETFKKLINEKLGVSTDQIRVIPNFIDTDFFTLAKEKLFDDSSFTFLTVCFLEKKKRLDRLIEAFYNAFKNNENIKLVIGGKGPEKGTIAEKIAKYDLGNQVTLVGSLSQSEVRGHMQACDFFVLASDVETFGVVLIEAMATGKPVLATRSGGPEDFVNEQVGILADPDLDSVTGALKKAKQNINTYRPEQIRQYVLNNFSGQSVANKVTELYLEIYNSQR